MDDHRAIREHLDTIRNLGQRDDTIRSRHHTLRALCRELEVPLLKAQPEHLAAWQRQLRVSVSSVATYTVHTRSFYSWAHDAELIKRNPAARLRVPRVAPRLPRPIPEPDLTLAIDTAMEPVRTWLLLSAYTGLRAGEIARLRPCDVDFDARRLTIDGKGGKQRRVPAPRLVLDALRLHTTAGKRGPIWWQANGAPMRPNRVTVLCSRHFRELGMSWTLHCARHRFGTMVYAGTPDIRVVQEILGHGSCATTQLYVLASEEKAEAAVDLLAERLKRGHPRTYPDAA